MNAFPALKMNAFPAPNRQTCMGVLFDDSGPYRPISHLMVDGRSKKNCAGTVTLEAPGLSGFWDFLGVLGSFLTLNPASYPIPPKDRHPLH
jgi:hypothetical protein